MSGRRRRESPTWASLGSWRTSLSCPHHLRLGHLQPSRDQQQDGDACKPEKQSGRRGGKKTQKKERKSKTCTLGPVPLITTAKPHQGFTLLEGEKATQRCPAPEVLEVGDPHTLSSTAYGLHPRRGAFFFCSVIKSGAWSFPSIPRIALN